MIHVLVLSDTHHIVKSLSVLIRTEPCLRLLDPIPDLIHNFNHLPDHSVLIADIHLENIERLIEQFSEKYRILLYSGSLEMMDISPILQKYSCRFFNAYSSPEEIIELLLGGF